ncbi:small ribosomal subunit protein mS34-like [Clavelina lepadiformis]|uniref:small ribosomal subunit protein mS34-like n=1 Tax=Clavelina lepadiformis TaxID=159417 RepID=UPI0040410DC6
MAQIAAGVERKLMTHVARKYPMPMHKIMQKRLEYPTESMLQRRKNEKRLFQVLSQLPHWGIGRIITTCQWADNSLFTYWRITRVHVDHNTEEYEYGIAWGIQTVDGRSKGYEEEIPDMNEHLWRLIPKYKEDYYLNYQPKTEEIKEIPLYIPTPPLLHQMMKAEKEKQGSEDANKDFLVRLLINRGRTNLARQRLDDGSLV